MWGRGKVRNESEKEPATSINFPSTEGKRTKNSTSSSANRLLYTRKVPATSHLEKREGGVYSAFLVPRPSRPARLSAARGTLARSRLPTARCSPYLAPGCLCAAASPPPARGCQRDNCGAAGRPGRSGVRGAGAAGGRSYLPSREKAMPIPSRGAVPLNLDLPGFRQLAAIANRPRKVWRRRKRLERKFSLAPHSLSPSLGGGKAAGNQDSRRAGSGVHLLLSRPRQRAQGGCPAPGLPAPSPGPASRDAARPTHHGDSRRDRASGVSRCRGAGAGTQSPGRTSEVGSLRQKQALDNPRTHKNQWEPWGDSIQAGSAAVGEGEQEAA